MDRSMEYKHYMFLELKHLIPIMEIAKHKKIDEKMDI